MEPCERCVKLTTKVESLTAQNKKILELLKVLNAAKKHKEQLIDNTLEFIKSKDEDYKKEKTKIKELAIRVKNTTTESVLKNVPKQIDECSALYIQKSTELQNYAQSIEMARVAKLELETKTLELDGNRMYVKQLIADADQERARNKTLLESVASSKLAASKANAKLKRMEKECAMLTNVHVYQAKVEAGVKKALKKLEANEPNSTKSCLKILNNLVSFFTEEPLFVKRIKKEVGENSKDVDRNDSPHSVSSGYSSGTGSPWTTPYNTPQQSEQINTQFTCSFTPDGNFVLSPAPHPTQSTSANSCATNVISTDTNCTSTNSISSGNTTTQYSITSPCVTSVFSPPHPIKTELTAPATAECEIPDSHWSMGCDASSDDDENVAENNGNNHQNETDDYENDCDKETSSSNQKTLTNKQNISDKVIEKTVNRANTIRTKKLEETFSEKLMSTQCPLKSRNKSVASTDLIDQTISQTPLEGQTNGADKAGKSGITCEKPAEVEASLLATTSCDNRETLDVDMEPLDIPSEDQQGLSKSDNDTNSDNEDIVVSLEETLPKLSTDSCKDVIFQLPDIGVDTDYDSKSEVNKKKDVEMESNKDKIVEKSLDKQETNKRLAMFGTSKKKENSKTKSAKKNQSLFSPKKSQPLDSRESKKKTKKEIQKELAKAAKLLEENLFDDIVFSEKEETPPENSKISNPLSIDNTTELDKSRKEKDVGFSVANGFLSSSLSDDESVDLDNDDEDKPKTEKSVITVDEIKDSTWSKKTDGEMSDSTGSNNCLKTSADESLNVSQARKQKSKSTKPIQDTKQKSLIKSIETKNQPILSDVSLKTRDVDLPVAKDDIPPKRHSFRNSKSEKPSDKKPATRRSTRKSNNPKQTSDESDGDDKPLSRRLRRKTSTPQESQETCGNKSKEIPVKRQSLRRKTTRNSFSLDSSLDENGRASISKDLETSLSDTESMIVENGKGGTAGNNSSVLLEKVVKTDDNIIKLQPPQEACEEKKETYKTPTTRQSKRKSSNILDPSCQDPSYDEKSVNATNEPRTRRQSTRKRGNSQRICDDTPESNNDESFVSDDDKPVKRQSLRTRKSLQQSSDVDKSTGRYSLRKLDNTLKEKDTKEVIENEEKKPGRRPSLKRKTTRNSSRVGNSVADAETAVEDVASSDTKINNSSVDNTCPINEIIDTRSSVINEEFKKPKAKTSMETEATEVVENIEESTDNESLLNEDLMEIFKDMEVYKNITIVEDMTASPCLKRKVKPCITRTPLRKLSLSSDDEIPLSKMSESSALEIPLSKISESSDSDDIVPNEVEESNENNANLELEENASDMDNTSDIEIDKRIVQTEANPPLSSVNVPNDVKSDVEDNTNSKLEGDTFEINKFSIPTDVLSNELELEDDFEIQNQAKRPKEDDEIHNKCNTVPTKDQIEEEEDPLKIVKNEIIIHEMNTDRIENDEDSRLVDSNTNENEVPDKNEMDDEFSVDDKASLSQNTLCSLDKFNTISKSILPKPVLFVSSSASKVESVKDELTLDIDKCKDFIASSNVKEPTPVIENKLEHPQNQNLKRNINSKPIEGMRNRHIPIHCVHDQNRAQSDPFQRNKIIQKFNPMKLETTVNNETKKSDGSQNESILSPTTSMNVVEANVIVRTRKSRVAHPNNKLQQSSPMDKSESKQSELTSIESKKSGVTSPIQSNQKKSFVEDSTNIVKDSLVEIATKNKIPTNSRRISYNCNLNLVKPPSFVDNPTSPAVNGTCNLNIAKENPIQKLSSPIIKENPMQKPSSPNIVKTNPILKPSSPAVKNQEPRSAVDNKTNLNGVKANTIHKNFANSRKINQILRKMKLLDKFPLIDVIPATPPFSLSNGTGFKNENGYNSHKSSSSQGKCLDSPNKTTFVGDVEISEAPKNPNVEMSESLNEDSSNQNVKLKHKVKKNKKVKSVREEQTHNKTTLGGDVEISEAPNVDISETSKECVREDSNNQNVKLKQNVNSKPKVEKIKKDKSVIKEQAEDYSNQNVKLKPKVKKTKKDKSAIEEKTNANQVHTICDKTTYSNVDNNIPKVENVDEIVNNNVTKLENLVDGHEILEINSDSSPVIIEILTCGKEENLNSSCDEDESEAENVDLVIETDDEDADEDKAKPNNNTNDLYNCNTDNNTANSTNINDVPTKQSSDFNIDSSNSSNNQFCHKLQEPHNITTCDGFLEEPPPNKSSFSRLSKSSRKEHVSSPAPSTNESMFPKCIQAKLSGVGSKPHLPIYNINTMNNIAHNIRQSSPTLDKQIKTNTLKMTIPNGTEKTINSCTNELPAPNKTAGLHQEGFRPPPKATPANNFYEHKSTNHLDNSHENGGSNYEASFQSPPKSTPTTNFYGQNGTDHLNNSHVNGSNYKEGTNMNAMHTAPIKDNVHIEAVAKPMNNDAPILPTLSFYNSIRSVASPNKRKCQDDITEESSKKQKTNSEIAIVNNTENVADQKNATKDYKLLKRAMDHMQEEIDQDKPAMKNPNNKALDEKLKVLFVKVHMNDKVGFDKKIRQIAKEISVAPFENLSRKLIGLFDNEQLIDNTKEMSMMLTKVFCTILEVVRHQPEFLPVFKKTILETITLHCETTLLSITYSLVRLYVGLCRVHNDTASVMTLLYDAIYFHRKRAINIMDATLTRWPSVYPVGSRCVRVKVMSIILLNQQNNGHVSHDQSVFVKTKQLLRHKYRYREQYTYKSILEELMVMLRDEQKCSCHARSNKWNNSRSYNSNDNFNSRQNNRNTPNRGYNSTDNSFHQRSPHSSRANVPSSNCCIQSALILLAKHWAPSEMYNAVVDTHLATLFRSSLDCGRLSVAATCAELMGMIGKAMPRSLSLVCSLSMLDTLKGGLHHPACSPQSPVRLSIARATAWLASHNTERALDVLSSVVWSDDEVNDLVEHIASKVIVVKNIDWWRASLERWQNQISV